MKLNGSIQLTRQDWEAVDKAIEYIELFHTKHLTALDLSDMFSVGEAELRKGLKAKTGSTIFSYITEKRMVAARNILAGDPRIGIKEVAQSVGYKTATHFCQVFKGRFGESPASFRRKANSIVIEINH